MFARSASVAAFFALLALPSAGNEPTESARKLSAAAAASALKVSVVAVGPTDEELQALNASLPSHPALQGLLAGNSYRHLYTDIIDADHKTAGAPPPPTRFLAVFYDYTNQRAIVAEGNLTDRSKVVANIVEGWQPDVSQEEWAAAMAILSSDSLIGSGLASGDLTTYQPLPRVQERDAGGNHVKQRVINVGLAPKAGVNRYTNEIVGVNLAARTIEHYPDRAPLGASAGGISNCGVPGAGQSTTSRGTSGQYQLTVSDATGVIWDMLVIRPSVSAGTRASGIEVRNVMYKGRSVLKRGHAPILNVHYVNDTCGPYRDWQYQEGMFVAGGADIPGAPGFRDSGTTPATTSLENGTDTGNFRGVAVYREGTEVVLVTELEAGWYRYIHEWRFDMNGAIRPRFGFAATTNGCTCQTHMHHVYFRLDMDVDGPVNQVYQIPVGALDKSDRANYRIGTETKITRVTGTNYFYRFRGGKRSYVLVPGANDGIADTFGRGDMWLLKYQTGATNLQAEIDDGVNLTTGPGVEANLDQFLTGESIDKQDVVAWYHATVTHSPTIGSLMCTATGLGIPGRNILTGDNVVGPDLLPEDF